MSKHTKFTESNALPSTVHLQTALSQPIRQAPQYIHTVQTPIYRASTIIFKDTNALNNRHWSDDYDYSYGTHGTPTTYNLADQIAHIEGAKYCLLAPSGLSAINLVNSALLNTGDEVWIPDNIYSPNHDHLVSLQQKYGVVLKIYSPTDLDSIQFSSQSKLLWIEVAGSITLEFPDLATLIKKAKAQGVMTALDNTWGAGLAFSPFDIYDANKSRDNEKLAVDMSVHALTKYPSGGGDILMGSICTIDKKLHLELLRMHALQGIAVSGDDCAQISRSVSHMALRYQQHHQNTLKLIPFLQSRAEFSQVLHPSIASHAGHQYWKAICQDGLGAGIVSVIFRAEYQVEQIQQFCNTLRLFHLGFSWGGPTSLVMYYDLKAIRKLPTPHLQDGWLVRFCIGLEHADDLIKDIAQALDAFSS
ncbi:cystathionine beta-lyase [Acinetobacter marinus]|uniref:Cystathionine beta-lyase n=1 Tax=Acinetobacter marinus TaxID=281375 RepID=A0A1G6HH12_9GAMM|nr:PLP-dependent transferase [Acinetobacter marinus]SDB93532.1 cystathionine beta-lyase [Acinetobacter marinus]